MKSACFSVFVVLGLAVGPAFAANKSVIVINESSHTILQVQATNSGDENWGENLISDTIPPGSQEEVDLEDGATTCIYDIRVLQRGGFSAEDFKINACKVESWTVTD